MNSADQLMCCSFPKDVNTAVCESLFRSSGLRNTTVIPKCSDMDNKQSEYCGVLYCAETRGSL